MFVLFIKCFLPLVPVQPGNCPPWQKRVHLYCTVPLQCRQQLQHPWHWNHRRCRTQVPLVQAADFHVEQHLEMIEGVQGKARENGPGRSQPGAAQRLYGKSRR